MASLFVGVEFDNDGGLAVVPHKWLTPLKSQVFWPPYKNQLRFNKAVESSEDPDDVNWKLYAIKRRFFETDIYSVAQTKIKKLEVTSDIQTDADDASDIEIPCKRKRIPNQRFLSDEDSDEFDEENQEEKVVTSNSKRHHRPTSIARVQLKSPPPLPSLNRYKSQQLTNCYGSPQIQTCSNNIISLNALENSTPKTSVSNEKLLTILLQVREQNSQIIEYLKKERTLNVVSVNQLNVSFDLPVKSQEDLDNFELSLNNKEKLTSLITYLSTLGGRDIIPKVNKILKTLISDEVATNFSYCGKRNGKKPFCQLLLKSAIVDAIKQSTPHSTDKEIEDSIKVWLKHAPQRVKISKSKENKLVC